MTPQEQAKCKRGRPRVGRGVRVISVSVERDLLARADALARRLNISRAALIARALRVMLAAYGER
jgi:metal-responsive CopG/Arc/MetJ family transcriptional regulator